MAIDRGVEHVIKKRDGTIGERNTYRRSRDRTPHAASVEREEEPSGASASDQTLRRVATHLRYGSVRPRDAHAVGMAGSGYELMTTTSPSIPCWPGHTLRPSLVKRPARRIRTRRTWWI